MLNGRVEHIFGAKNIGKSASASVLLDDRNMFKGRCVQHNLRLGQVETRFLDVRFDRRLSAMSTRISPWPASRIAISI